MAYLNLDFDYFDHPKTIRMVSILGPAGAAIPIRLWAKAAKFFPRDGFFKGHSVAEIECLIGWQGNSGQAVEALIFVGYLVKKEDGYQAHDWKHHQGHIWALKQRNKKSAQTRWENIRKEKAKQQSVVDTSRTRDEYVNTDSRVPLAFPILTIPDQTNQQPKVRKGAFAPPSIEEVRAYCLERGKGIDPQKWHDYYSSNGWRVGKNSMKDWRAAVRTWEANQNGYGTRNGAKRTVGLEAPVPGKYSGL